MYYKYRISYDAENNFCHFSCLNTFPVHTHTRTHTHTILWWLCDDDNDETKSSKNNYFWFIWYMIYMIFINFERKTIEQSICRIFKINKTYHFGRIFGMLSLFLIRSLMATKFGVKQWKKNKTKHTHTHKTKTAILFISNH